MREHFADLEETQNGGSGRGEVALDYASLSGVQRFVLPPLKREVELQV